MKKVLAILLSVMMFVLLCGCDSDSGGYSGYTGGGGYNGGGYNGGGYNGGGYNGEPDYFQCALCNGRGYTECYACYGKGCSFCDRGYVDCGCDNGVIYYGSNGGGGYTAPTTTACNYCENGYVKCGTCNGTGKYGSYTIGGFDGTAGTEVSSLCPACGGAKKQMCNVCYGMGYTY